MTADQLGDIVERHRRRLREREAIRHQEAPEAQLADLVPELLVGVARALNRPGVELLGQPYEGPVGRPDFSVRDGALLIGYVETKAPGLGADTGRYKGRDREQARRFANLPNVLYTDGLDFALYRSGQRAGPVIRLDPVGAMDPSAVSALAGLVAELLQWRAVAPPSLLTLADQLAPLCALLRDAVRAELDRPGSQARAAAGEVEDALFAHRAPDEVADAFAQVCTYSMLLARSRGAERLEPGDVERTLALGHPVLGRVVRLLLDPGTEAELGWAVEPVRALVEAVDFPALEARDGPDAWLYFYETFLARYDPRLRDQYGVYYTPAQIIAAQVTLLDEIVRTRFELPDGLAAEGVTVLDPAVGTGSYPLQVIEAAARSTERRRGRGSVPGVVSALGRSLFAFEVLVGPYAVAHLRISELLAKEGGRLLPDGPQVFLTDTLENPFGEALTLSRQLEPLVEERRRAQEVKRRQEILVCLGNPPYERLSREDEEGEPRGGWVVHGEGRSAEAPPIFSTFLDPARAHTRFSHVASLYNLYVYFWRWALWKVFEAPGEDGAPNERPGVVSFISAASYLTGPGFLGMREHLRRVCDEVWVIDLGGEGRGTRREENVFAIQTPVAICMAVRSEAPDPERPATVRYARIRGTRPDKLAALRGLSELGDLEWEEAATNWHAPLVPAGQADWLRYPALVDLFPLQLPGPMINRTWPVAPLRSIAARRWAELAAAPAEDKAALFAESRFGRSTTTRSAGGFPPPASREPIAETTSESTPPPVVAYGYRSFDRQWIVADVRVMRTPSQTLWWAYSSQQVHLISFATGVVGSGPAAVLSAAIPDKHYFRGSFGGKDVFPLYRDPAGTQNITQGLLAALSSILATPVAAEDLFAYAYSLLSCRGYTERFWDELETPGPRLPITRDSQLFGEVAKCGRTLINLHSFGQRLPDLGRGVNPGRARLERPIGPAMPEEFAYHADERALGVGAGWVTPVDPGVWEYEVSGLHVVQSWLRYRMREPAGRARSSSSDLDRIRPEEWTRELDDDLLELLWVVERTLALEPRQRELLDRVCSGATVAADELPIPTAAEREPPTLPRGDHEDTDDAEG